MQLDDIEVFLLLGSNMGDRKKYIADATMLILAEAGEFVAASSLYETGAWGNTGQPDFINQALKIRTSLPAQKLLQTVLAIEQQLGRVREEKWGSRTIDIDIIFYGNELINEENLVIPHPQMQNRRFVLDPLCELAPSFVHPVFGKKLIDMNNELHDELLIKKIKN